jgi:hypothetical protein
MKRCTGERCIMQAGKIDPAKCQAVNVCEYATPEEELAPCPHCGYEAVRIEQNFFGPFIYCDGCDSKFALDSVYASRERLARAWNRRTQDAQKLPQNRF